MSLDTFSAYQASKQRIASKTHSTQDEVIDSLWASGCKLIDQNNALLKSAAENKALLDEALTTVRRLTARNDILESRGQPNVKLADMLHESKSQA